MSRQILIWVVLIIALPIKTWAVNVSFEGLKDLIETKNEKVVGQRKKVEAAKIREGFLTRSYLPKLSINGGYESFKVGSTLSEQQPYYGLEASMNIYNGGKDQLQEGVQDLVTQSNKSRLKIVIAKELATARELFWRIVFFKKELNLLDKMLGINEKNLKSANRRIKSGVATPSDRIEFEMKSLDLKRNISLVSAELRSSSYDLLVRLGHEPHESLEITGQLEHADEWESDLKHSHKDHDYLTKPSELLAKELQLKKQQQQRAWTPALDLYAGWYQFNQREEDPQEARERQESVVGVKLTMNLFEGFSARSEAKAMALEASAALAQSSFSKKENEAHIEKEFLELKTLHDQVHEAEKHIAMATQYFKATKLEYSRGAKNSPDMLGATERLETVTRTKNELVRDFQIARSHVLSKIGK